MGKGGREEGWGGGEDNVAYDWLIIALNTTTNDN